jgi:ABC-type antimicrobial peptide transport system, permease component
MRDFEGKIKAGIVGRSVIFAFSQLKNDKFRTMLSLLGVSIGIFAIVAVMTLVDSIRDSITEGFEKFGSDVVFVEQLPIEPDLNEDGVFRWWEYISRPRITYREYQALSDAPLFSKLAFTCYFSAPATFEGRQFTEGETIGVTNDWKVVVQNQLISGRIFSETELLHGSPVTIIGSEVAEKLFGKYEASIGRTIKLKGHPATVIGVFARSGVNSVSLVDVDKVVAIPLEFARTIVDINQVKCNITASPTIGISSETFQDEIRSYIRLSRRLKPSEKDNFSINRLSFVVDEMKEIFETVNKLGWIVGVFALLIGGFGIANIMLVSVKERTGQIGIQKALGAPRSIITIQFLTESAALSLLGGLVGIILVTTLVLVISSLPAYSDTAGKLFKLSLNLSDAVLGILISLIIGIIAGVIPARRAASLRPVEAINYQE